MHRRYRPILALTTIVLLLFAHAGRSGTSAQWGGSLYPGEPVGGFSFGVWPGSQDGYDGLPLATSWSVPGVHILLYRTNGPSWSGPTGFYGSDMESPIPEGGSKTWWDIYLWSYN